MPDVVSPAAPAAPAPIIPVAAVVDKNAEAAYVAQINGLFSQWGGQPPRTDIVLPVTDPATDSGSGNAPPAPTATQTQAAPPSDPNTNWIGTADVANILIPAGRGIWAHPILALSSDQVSPVVLQADSGPIAGDRMIGSFATEHDRLVIEISTVVHDGQNISVNGLVVAPDTMEAGVASGIDQHYVARFVLPAAAAFVAGLGQAIETTSNSTAVLSPFGGATTTSNLNINQQLGVAAGAAAAQIGATLRDAAPKGPTITLAANVSVGVMFLSNVTDHPQQ
jgi:intracellular multiplication protein IcmE